MMLSPKNLEDEYLTMSYEELLEEKQSLLDYIYRFESGNIDKYEWNICPGPDVQYQMNLEYLGVLAPIIAKKYRDKRDMEEEMVEDCGGIPMPPLPSDIQLIYGSVVYQNVDAIVNAANKYLAAGGGVCGAIFKKAGLSLLQNACNEYDVPLKDGEAVITPAFNIENATHIIHAVGPDFSVTPRAFKELNDAYYNSLKVLMQNGLHSIAFPLISSGIFGGNLKDPVETSAKECVKAYKYFRKNHPDYPINVLLCVYDEDKYSSAEKAFEIINGEI